MRFPWASLVQMADQCTVSGPVTSALHGAQRGSLWPRGRPTMLTARPPQVPAELHPRPQPHPLVPRVPPDLHPAREGGGRAAEQLLHHQPDGRAAAVSRQQRRGLLHSADRHCRGCRQAAVVPKPRWECKWGPAGAVLTEGLPDGGGSGQSEGINPETGLRLKTEWLAMPLPSSGYFASFLSLTKFI